MWRWFLLSAVAAVVHGIQFTSPPFDVLQQIGANLTTIHEITFTCGLSDFDNPQSFDFTATTGETHKVVITCHAPNRIYKLTKKAYGPAKGTLNAFAVCDSPNPIIANITVDTSLPGFVPIPGIPIGPIGSNGDTPSPARRRLLESPPAKFTFGLLGKTVLSGFVSGYFGGVTSSAICNAFGFGCESTSNIQTQLTNLQNDVTGVQGDLAAYVNSSVTQFAAMNLYINTVNNTVQLLQDQLNSATDNFNSVKKALDASYQQAQVDVYTQQLFRDAASKDIRNLYDIANQQQTDNTANFVYLNGIITGDAQLSMQYAYNITTNLFNQFSTYYNNEVAQRANIYSQLRSLISSIQAQNTLTYVLYTQSNKKNAMNPAVQKILLDLPSRNEVEFLDDHGKAPANDPLNLPSDEFTIIDTYDGLGIRNRDGVPYGVQTTMTLKCSSNFLSDTSPFKSSFLDVMSSFGPTNCSTTQQGLNYCQCWMDITQELCAMNTTIPPQWDGDYFANGLTYINATGTKVSLCLNGGDPTPYTPNTCDAAGGNCGYNGVSITNMNAFVQMVATVFCNYTAWNGQGFKIFSERLPARAPTFPGNIAFTTDVCNAAQDIIQITNGVGPAGSNVLSVLAQLIGISWQTFLSGAAVGTTLQQTIEAVKGYLPNYMTQILTPQVRTAIGSTYDCLQLSFMSYDPNLIPFYEITPLDTTTLLEVTVDGVATNYTGFAVTNAFEFLLPQVAIFAGDPFSSTIQYNTPDIISLHPIPQRREFDYAYAVVNSTDPAIAASQFGFRNWVANNGALFNHPAGSVMAGYCSQTLVGGLCQGYSNCEGNWCVRREHFAISGDPVEGLLFFNDNDNSVSIQATIQVPNGPPVALLGSNCPIVTSTVSNSDEVRVYLYNQLNLPNKIQVVQIGGCPLSTTEIINAQDTFTYPAFKCLVKSSVPQSLQFYYTSSNGTLTLCSGVLNLQFNNTNVVAAYNGAAGADLVDQVNVQTQQSAYSLFVQLGTALTLSQITLVQNQLTAMVGVGALVPPSAFDSADFFAQQANATLTLLYANSIGTVQALTNYTELENNITTATELALNATQNALDHFALTLDQLRVLNAEGNIAVALLANASIILKQALAVSLNTSIAYATSTAQLSFDLVDTVGQLVVDQTNTNPFGALGGFVGGMSGYYIHHVIGDAEAIGTFVGDDINAVGHAVGEVLGAIGSDFQAAFNAVVGTGGCSGLIGAFKCCLSNALASFSMIGVSCVILFNCGLAAVVAWLLYKEIMRGKSAIPAKPAAAAPPNLPPAPGPPPAVVTSTLGWHQHRYHAIDQHEL